MKFSRCFTLAFMLVSASVAQYSCRPASYEIIKPKKNKNVSEKGDPNSISPDQGDKGESAPPPILTNVPPTARMEVIWNNQSVTKVRVNSPVSVKPSYDTLDPDDIGISQCTNPGIVKSEYTLDYQNNLAAVRTNGCETLAVPYTFTRTGEFEISMIVTSNENETAIASMTIVVVGENESLTAGDDGLVISADPMVAGKGQIITFTGSCGLKKKHAITWDFGDGTSATGSTVKHSFDKESQFRVEATCTDEDGKAIKSVITIVVIDKPVTIPGQPFPGQPDDQIPGAPPSDQPGQIPGQQPGQKPGQA